MHRTKSEFKIKYHVEATIDKNIRLTVYIEDTRFDRIVMRFPVLVSEPLWITKKIFKTTLADKVLFKYNKLRHEAERYLDELCTSSTLAKRIGEHLENETIS